MENAFKGIDQGPNPFEALGKKNGGGFTERDWYTLENKIRD